MFLLTIALQVFTLMEFVVRRQLAQSDQSLPGLYDGNPKRTTQISEQYDWFCPSYLIRHPPPPCMGS
ncbi:MAG: hypothetical protein AB4426_21535 [Xenococcaceae cyanobacterium]